MTTKQLGYFALIGAPCLAIGLGLEALNGGPIRSAWMGVWGVLYISGWMAAIIALRRLGVLEAEDPTKRRFGRVVGQIILVTLTLANVLNVWEVIAPTYKPTFYYLFDLGWPASNLMMLAVGVVILRANQLRGWMRWIPLLVGLWLPVVLLIKNVPSLAYMPHIYSAVAWSLLALVVISKAAQQQRHYSLEVSR